MTAAQDIVKFFAKYIEGQLGIIYNDANYFQLEPRLNDLVTLLSLSSLEELYGKAQLGLTGDMRQMVLDVATNNETSFFRDTDLFGEFRDQVLTSDRFNGKNGKTLRIWCAATSTGQEPYSIAMILEEQMARFPGRTYHLSFRRKQEKSDRKSC